MMNCEENVKRYNRMKLINQLLDEEDNKKIRNIKNGLIQDCDHIWLCTNKKEEYSGVIETKEGFKLRVVGNQYSVICPICNTRQVFYFPIETIPDFSTEIFENSYEIFIALLENDINKANDILESALEINKEKENFEDVINSFKTQLGIIGYFINHENKILKITTGGN